MARPGPGRQIPRSLGAAGPRQPASRRARPGLLSPLRNRLQSRRAGQRRQHPCRRALPRRQGERRALDHSRGGQAERQARPRGRSGPERPVRRLPPGATRSSNRDPRGRPAPRRHAALRHSRLPLAARRADAGDLAHRGDGRPDRARAQGRGCPDRDGFRAVRRGVRGHRRPGWPAYRHSRPRRRACHHRRQPAARCRRRRSTKARATRRDLRRRKHGDGRRPDGQAPGRRGSPDRLLLGPGAHGSAQFRGGRGAVRGREDQMA